MTRSTTDALRGSLDLLVLKTLSLEAMHGWGISQRIQQISKGALEVNQGSLYPALQRLEKLGLITSDWDTSDNNRRARYYKLTASVSLPWTNSRAGASLPRDSKRCCAPRELVSGSTRAVQPAVSPWCGGVAHE